YGRSKRRQRKRAGSEQKLPGRCSEEYCRGGLRCTAERSVPGARLYLENLLRPCRRQLPECCDYLQLGVREASPGCAAAERPLQPFHLPARSSRTAVGVRSLLRRIACFHCAPLRSRPRCTLG